MSHNSYFAQFRSDLIDFCIPKEPKNKDFSSDKMKIPSTEQPSIHQFFESLLKQAHNTNVYIPHSNFKRFLSNSRYNKLKYNRKKIYRD